MDLPNGDCSTVLGRRIPNVLPQVSMPQRAFSLFMFKTIRELQNVEGFAPSFPKMHCKLGQREIYPCPLKQNGSRSRASAQALFHWWNLQLWTGSWDHPQTSSDGPGLHITQKWDKNGNTPHMSPFLWLLPSHPRSNPSNVLFPFLG